MAFEIGLNRWDWRSASSFAAGVVEAESLGIDPTACVYVGDRSYEDVHGPQAVGMRAIWIPHSDIPEDQQVSHEATPDAVAHELSDIADIVLGWCGRST